MTSLFLKHFRQVVIPAMKKKFGYTNDLEVPRIEKVTINVGTGPAKKDPKLLEVMTNTLKKITGQIPVICKAKKSISGFGIKKGEIVGLKVTLRRKRMEDFLTKLIHVTLPRIRDFRGLNSSGFDKHGNFTLGIKEHTVFPEIKADEVEKIHGLEITIVTTAKKDVKAKELLKLFGFPFRD